MGNVIGGYEVDSGERVLLQDDNDAGLNVEFMKDVRATSAGKKFFADYFSEDNYIAVLEAVGKLYPNADCITVSMWADAADTMIRSGEIQPMSEPELAPVEQAPVPTDRNGRKLRPQQIAWGEMSRWSQTASSAEVKKRRQTDPAYASFVHKNYVREMNEEGVGDAVVNLNQRPTPSGDQNIPELQAWVANYKKLPVAEARKCSRADTNPDGYKLFNKMLNLAAAGGLI